MKRLFKYYLKHAFVLIIISLVLISGFEFSCSIVMAANTGQYDLVIKGGTIINPSTEHSLAGYNIGISDGKIARITTEDILGTMLIDASGLTVVPGFIDLISYEPNNVGIPLKIHDGVTSNLLMHGGTDNAKAWYNKWVKKGLPVNFGASSFITTMRWPIIGKSIDRSITKEEDIQKLVNAVRKNIEEGALGISFSFEYIPGIKSNEVIPLLHLASEYNAPTFYHTRYSSAEPPNTGPVGIEEVLEYARQTGAAVHIMHINSTGGTYYMKEALDMLKAARDEGIDVTACVYPYNGWATYLSSARFRPGWQQRFRITYEDLQITGTAERVTEETFAKYRQQGKLVYAHDTMPEEELILALQDSHVMIGSDTITSPSLNNHPRGAGNYARLFGRYVREKGVLTMMEAVKKTSLMPAQRLESIAPSMKRKGRIEIGCDADITIFNHETIIDRSTPENPGLPSAGIEYVIVNGVIVKDPTGIKKDVNPGKPIYSYFVDEGTQEQPIVCNVIIDGTNTMVLENVYKLNDKMYLPIDVLEKIGMQVFDKGDGEIVIDDAVRIKIGSDIGYYNDDIFRITCEPIIYSGNVYIDFGTFNDLIGHRYESSLSDNTIELITKETETVVTEDTENKTPKAEGKGMPIFVGLVSAVLVIAVSVYSKANKKDM